ncbi:hypothetical protein HWB57_gp158 [Erwinia phage vB_EamM-Bue1]|uniref:Uncharacterized protein n=1 Tax=Erwinia phage vB_EamM-Bue1 TaxID=2099338 RepID=A0A2P1JUF9_9CAUD|nr:hypothetical protein HWB57_gp158 [Erwinia phage vB_EamM-Bue1]AVO22995.1 hypothetical protein [Erwinia phage vB_EamM-Bue1]
MITNQELAGFIKEMIDAARPVSNTLYNVIQQSRLAMPHSEQEVHRGRIRNLDTFCNSGRILVDSVNAMSKITKPVTAPAPVEQHPDDEAIDAFAAAMKAKMARSRDKGRSGWEDRGMVTDEQLAEMLIEHLGKTNAGNFEDVAIFCMMLHHRKAPTDIIMSTQNPELTTELMNEALKKHYLVFDKPSQMSDSFRAGARWAVSNARECEHNFKTTEVRFLTSVKTCTKCGEKTGEPISPLED